AGGRAVRCAAEMQKAMADFNAAQRASGGPELGVGIAVHSGPVVAGNVGSETRMDYTVMGDTVNLTQRMQSRAAAGKVLVSDAARARAGEGFSYAELEPFQVKGRQEPVKAFELLF
ncbi:MAG TPA: adenylate/guanylate cyclase domain-containing protein, partial [Elusimicrobiales bacterium]|nr:adenylate/guanylate cyclase domain-containing protein [Elusimicrobiales bacterium]